MHSIKHGSWEAVRWKSSGKEPRCLLGMEWKHWVKGNVLAKVLNVCFRILLRVVPMLLDRIAVNAID